MLENNYFSHISPWYWFDEAGYAYKNAGENLASDYYDTKKVTDAWINSPLHRRNILNPKYTEIGVAIETGEYQGRKVAFVVQMFGSPRYPLNNITQLAINEPTQEINHNPFPQITATPQVLGAETTRNETQEVTMTQTSPETMYEPSEEENFVPDQSIRGYCTTQPIKRL
jgi:hypothetical protein